MQMLPAMIQGLIIGALIVIAMLLYKYMAETCDKEYA